MCFPELAFSGHAIPLGFGRWGLGNPNRRRRVWGSAGASDLFVGRWIYLDAREREIHHAIVAPLLIVTIFFGPIGFALYGLILVGQALNRRSDVA